MEEGVVQRTVCFSWSSTCCFAEVKVQVRNCYGYHVYKLQPTSFVVKARYCIGKLVSSNQLIASCWMPFLVRFF